MRLKKKLTVIPVALVAMLLVMLPTSAVFAAETSLGVTLTGGSLSVTSPATAAYGGKTVVSAADQTDTAVIGNATHTDTTGIRVLDERGSGAGWSCTMTVTNLAIMKSAVKLSGLNSTVTFSGTYDGALGVQDTYKVFRVKITTGGAIALTKYSWYKPGNDGTTPDGTAVAASVAATALSNGVSIAFTEATYAVGDEWSVLVDVFPYNYGATKGLTITPSAIHAAYGVATGMTAGSAVLVSGTAAASDPKTIMTAGPNYGLGDYYIDVDLSQIIHPNSLVGAYASVATITVA
ncbi:MAG: hypothetical protein ACYDIA_04635 [Candidatus Humimicrobiaceae bacterium]